MTASWLYAPDTFREGWVYKIGITVTDAFELEQAQLVTRHWRIKDFNGEESAVDGPGVVGFYPIVSKSMQPLRTAHAVGRFSGQSSCVRMRTRRGARRALLANLVVILRSCLGRKRTLQAKASLSQCPQ